MVIRLVGAAFANHRREVLHASSERDKVAEDLEAIARKAKRPACWKQASRLIGGLRDTRKKRGGNFLNL